MLVKSASVKPAAQVRVQIASLTAQKAAGVRRLVAPRAAAERRAVLGSLVAGITTIAAGKALADVTPVDLFDDRKAKKTGFDLIYEARDLDLDQATRDGLTQYRGDITATKARYKEATKRINKEVGQYIEKEYWTNAIEELRNQVGTFRFDLKNLASSKGDKAARKAGLVKAKALIQEAEQLDLALRKKDKSKAKDIYKSVLGLLNDFDSSL